MSIPLIQDNQKDSINASLIAIKREEERLQALIAEADKKIAQLNELKVNKSDIVDEVTLNNMQSVTSNAVAESIKGMAVEEEGILTNGYYIKYKNGLIFVTSLYSYGKAQMEAFQNGYNYTVRLQLPIALKANTTPIFFNAQINGIYGRAGNVWFSQGNNYTTDNEYVSMQACAFYPYELSGKVVNFTYIGWWK